MGKEGGGGGGGGGLGFGTQRSRRRHTEGNYPFGWKHPRVLFLEKEKRAINAKSVLSLPFSIFLSFDRCNSFFTYVLVCFLRV